MGRISYLWSEVVWLLITGIILLPGSSVLANAYPLMEQPNSSPPEMKWVLLPPGSTGTCVSNTDGCLNTFCYGLEYTPGISGELTSYTASFYVDCVMNGSPIISSTSCVMQNSSFTQNGCADFGVMQMQCLGNTGQVDVTAGVPILIHQVCFTIPPGVTIHVIDDPINEMTTAIDPPVGSPETEYPDYLPHMFSHSIVVTNNNDTGSGSLRHLINCAPGGSTITFAPALTNQTITLTSGPISINKSLTVAGPGMQAFTLSGNNTSGIFHVLPTFDFTLKDLSLINANAVTNGGAIYAQGNVTLQNVLLQNNFQNGVPKSMTVESGSILKFIGAVELKL